MQTLDQHRSSLSIDPGLLRAIKEVTRKQIREAQVILYGSHSRGEGRPESDLDLLIIVPDSATSVAEEELDRSLYDFELKQGVVLSTLIYRQSAWEQPSYRAMPLHQNIEREGILL